MVKKTGILRRLASGIISPKKREESPGTAPVENIEKAMNTMPFSSAKFQIGQVVKHRLFPFRGVIFDVDPEFANTNEWYEAIPEEVRPIKNQPYYHLFAENEKTHYVAYVSEQNLLPDETHTPVGHPDIPELFILNDKGDYQLKSGVAN